MKHYWKIRIELAIFDGIALKGRRIIPFLMQNQILENSCSNLMDIEKTRLLVRESVYWLNMNADIKNTVMQFATCFTYQETQHEKTIPYEVLCKS